MTPPRSAHVSVADVSQVRRLCALGQMRLFDFDEVANFDRIVEHGAFAQTRHRADDDTGSDLCAFEVGARAQAAACPNPNAGPKEDVGLNDCIRADLCVVAQRHRRVERRDDGHDGTTVGLQDGRERARRIAIVRARQVKSIAKPMIGRMHEDHQ